MRTTLCLALLTLTGACLDMEEETPSVDAVEKKIHIDPTTDGVEAVYINDVQCQMVFPGALTPETDIYAIWAVGTDGIVDAPYNTDARPDLFAVFGTSPQGLENHHVDGYDQFDHYHVIDSKKAKGDLKQNTWDLLTVWPGPNFDPATYESAKSVEEMFDQIDAGVLAGPLTLPEVGFPEVVLYSPIKCPKHPPRPPCKNR